MVQTVIHATDFENDELLRKVLGKDYATAGKNLPVLKKLIDKIGRTGSFFLS